MGQDLGLRVSDVGFKLDFRRTPYPVIVVYYKNTRGC